MYAGAVQVGRSMGDNAPQPAKNKPAPRWEHFTINPVSLPNHQTEFRMDDSTKREIWVLTFSTLAAVPTVTTFALAVVIGIVTW